MPDPLTAARLKAATLLTEAARSLGSSAVCPVRSVRFRPDGKGGEESFVAMHFVAGGGWDTGVHTGHLNPGTRVKGSMQVFVTELLDIEVQYPADYKEGDPYPENFYYSTTGKAGK